MGAEGRGGCWREVLPVAVVQGYSTGECLPVMEGKVQAPALYLYSCPFLRQSLTKNIQCTEQM